MKRNLIIIMSMLAALLIAAFGTAYGADSDLVAEVSDLTVSPDTVTANTTVNISFSVDEHFTGSQQKYFKAGQSTEISTNLYELFTNGTGGGTEPVTGDVCHESTGEVIGSIVYAPGKITITWNELAESYRMTHYASVFSLDYIFRARDINHTEADLTRSLEIGGASKDITWKGQDIVLAKAVSGNGSVSPSSATTFKGSVTEETITITPGTDAVLESVLLQKADGSEADLKDSVSGNSLTIRRADLVPGSNILYVTFSGDDVIPAEGDGSDMLYWAFLSKEMWGVDWDNYARMINRVNSDGLTQSFLHMNDQASINNKRYSSLIFEDTLPGSAKLRLNGIYAPLPHYKWHSGQSYAYPVEGREWNWAGKANITSRMNKIDQTPGETYESFKSKILSSPGYTWGVYEDHETYDNTILINFGAVGDKSVNDGMTYTDLYGTKITSDNVYSKALGNDNIFGGKLQYFMVDFYDDHSHQTFGGIYTNTAKVYYAPLGGDQKTASVTSNQYIIRRANARIVPKEGQLSLSYYDRDTNAGINGETFSLEKYDESTGSWVTYTDAGGQQVSGTTASDSYGAGYTEIPTLVPGRYRIVKHGHRTEYAGSTTVYSTGENSNFRVAPNGEFIVDKAPANACVEAVATDVKEVLSYRITYNSNGGQGQLTDSDTYREGHVWRVLSPGDAVTRRGYYFTGWNDKADGTGTSYPVNSEHIMGNKDITLYAQWKETNAAVLDSPSIVKALTILDAQPESDESFSFSCTPDKDNPADVRGLSKTAVISGSGALDEGFGRGLEFPKAGTYSFTVRENPGDSSHYEYDDSSYTWTVKVGEGRVSMSIEENKIDGNEIVGQGQFSFTNIYHRETELTPAKHDPPIKKVVSGDKPEKDAVFRFQLKAVRTTAEGVEVMPMPAGSEDGVKTVDVKGAGEYEFGDIVFTRAGHYEYEMSEIPTGENGYTYDGSVYRIVYIVSRHGNELKADRSITKDGEAADEAVFDNRYTAPAPEKNPDPKPEVKPGPSSGDTGGSSPEPSVTKKKDYKSSGDSGSSTKADTADEGKSSTSKASRIVKTGDAGILIPSAALVSAAVLLLAFAAARKKRSEN